jgi:hypothetical protein
MGTKETRERNQNWFLFKFREARKHGRYMDKKRIISQFCLEMFASDRMAKELLRLFENSGKIKVHKDRIEVLR